MCIRDSLWVEQTTMLTLRIHDKYHVALNNPQRNQYQDRFNQAINLQQGWNHLSISIQQIKSGPAKRSLDVSKIKSVGIFSTEPHDTDVFMIDSMVLKWGVYYLIDHLSTKVNQKRLSSIPVSYSLPSIVKEMRLEISEQGVFTVVFAYRSASNKSYKKATFAAQILKS